MATTDGFDLLVTSASAAAVADYVVADDVPGGWQAALITRDAGVTGSMAFCTLAAHRETLPGGRYDARQ